MSDCKKGCHSKGLGKAYIAPPSAELIEQRDTVGNAQYNLFRESSFLNADNPTFFRCFLVPERRIENVQLVTLGFKIKHWIEIRTGLGYPPAEIGGVVDVFHHAGISRGTNLSSAGHISLLNSTLSH